MAKIWVKMYGYAARGDGGEIFIRASNLEYVRDDMMDLEESPEVRKCVFSLEIDEDDLFPADAPLGEGKAKAESKQ